jgi:hypothetical protein
MNDDFDSFHKHFNDMDKIQKRSFIAVGIASIIIGLVIVAAIITGIYLAIKNWG